MAGLADPWADPWADGADGESRLVGVLHLLLGWETPWALIAWIAIGWLFDERHLRRSSRRRARAADAG